jgi:hypothetical protein
MFEKEKIYNPKNKKTYVVIVNPSYILMLYMPQIFGELP